MDSGCHRSREGACDDEGLRLAFQQEHPTVVGRGVVDRCVLLERCCRIRVHDGETAVCGEGGCARRMGGERGCELAWLQQEGQLPKRDERQGCWGGGWLACRACRRRSVCLVRCLPSVVRLRGARQAGRQSDGLQTCCIPRDGIVQYRRGSDIRRGASEATGAGRARAARFHFPTVWRAAPRL